MTTAGVIVVIIIILIIFPEIFAICALIVLAFFEFVLRLFGKSFDDK